MKPLKYIFCCALTIVFILCATVALDSMTGVPLSYGVLLSAILSLLPYAFLLRRADTAAAHEVERQDAPAGATANRRVREGRRRAVRPVATSKRPAMIHSVVFLPYNANRVGAARPPAPAPTVQQV